MLRFAFSSPSSALRTSYSSIYLRVSQLKSKLSRSAFISRSHTSLASKLHPDVAASDADIVTVAEQSRAVVAPGTQTVRIAHALPLDLGGHLPEVEINYAEWNIAPPGAPVVFVMPSMSHSALITNAELPAAAGTRGWWQTIVGTGSAFGIDLSRYRVIAASPLGGPFGSTSPVTVSPKTGRRYRAHFPQITPGDQARAHALLLDHLKIERVHAVVGGSMGGMQALCFATLFPHRVLRCVSLCATGRTSPTTQALRAVQRALVESDPCWQSGEVVRFLDSFNSRPFISYFPLHSTVQGWPRSDSRSWTCASDGYNLLSLASRV
jgi:pimeloyl-ACP methyl ester carboxylesterase